MTCTGRFCVLNNYKFCALIVQKIDHTSRQKLKIQLAKLKENTRLKTLSLTYRSANSFNIRDFHNEPTRVS